MKQALVVTCAMFGLTCGLAADTGSLASVDPQGKPLGLCPLKHTTVKAEIIRLWKVVRDLRNSFRFRVAHKIHVTGFWKGCGASEGLRQGQLDFCLRRPPWQAIPSRTPAPVT
jgi:hypothetical protein